MKSPDTETLIWIAIALIGAGIVLVAFYEFLRLMYPPG